MNCVNVQLFVFGIILQAPGTKCFQIILNVPLTVLEIVTLL